MNMHLVASLAVVTSLRTTSDAPSTGTSVKKTSPAGPRRLRTSCCAPERPVDRSAARRVLVRRTASCCRAFPIPRWSINSHFAVGRTAFPSVGHRLAENRRPAAPAHQSGWWSRLRRREPPLTMVDDAQAAPPAASSKPAPKRFVRNQVRRPSGRPSIASRRRQSIISARAAPRARAGGLRHPTKPRFLSHHSMVPPPFLRPCLCAPHGLPPSLAAASIRSPPPPPPDPPPKRSPTTS